MKIKKGDNIIVIAGKDRGKEGKVIRSFPKRNMILVEGVSQVSKHQKSKKRGSQGQIIQKPMPIPVANVGLKDTKTGKPVRVGYMMDGEGDRVKKIRVTRPSGSKV